jgi:serine kinase of HPr protein (carbohydrate metabolism regulator)
VLAGERGVLVRGRPGSGKSSLVLALIGRDPANRLVADDRVILTPVHGRLLAAAPPLIAGRLEVRGLGLLAFPHVSPVRLDLVVDLVAAGIAPRLPEAEEEATEIAGIRLARLILPEGTAEPAARVLLALARQRPPAGS